VIVFDFIGHIAFSVIIGYGLDYFLFNFTVKEMILYYIFIVIGAVLPDIDTPYSFLGCRLKPFSNILYDTVGHRTATHSILIITILFFIGVLIWSMNTILVGLMIGSIFHVVGDMMTPQGVAICYPVNKKRYRLSK